MARFPINKENFRDFTIYFIIFGFLYFSMISAYSQTTMSRESFFVQILLDETVSLSDTVSNRADFYRLPFFLTKNLDQKLQIFSLRIFSVFLGAISIWISYKFSLLIFKDEKLMALILPALLALSPLFFKYSIIAGGEILTMTLLILFLFTLVNFVAKDSYYNILFLVIPSFLFFRLAPDSGSTIIIPLIVIAFTYFITKKNKKRLISFFITLVIFAIILFLFLTNGRLANSSILFFSIQNLFNIFQPNNIYRLSVLSLNSFLLSTSAISIDFFTSIIASLPVIGLLMIVVRPIISLFRKISDYDYKEILHFISDSHDESQSKLTGIQMVSLIFFIFAFLIQFTIRITGYEGFFDVNTLPIVLLPSLGVLTFGLYGLYRLKNKIFFRASSYLLFSFVIFSRILVSL